jgi:hypothetical protein
MLSSTETYDGSYIFFAQHLSWEEVELIHDILQRPDFTQVVKEVVNELKKTELGEYIGITPYVDVDKKR